MIIICYFLCNSAYTHTGGDNRGTFGGKVILAKWGDYTKRIELMVLQKQLRKPSNQHLDLEQGVISGLKMKMRLSVPWTGICQSEHTHFILMMVIVNPLQFMGVVMFLCLVKGNWQI
jgi:hypothetical protein